MDGLFYATGMVFWGIVAALLAAWVVSLIRAMLVATDWCVWRISLAREHKVPVRWRYLPAMWWSRCRDFAGPFTDHTWHGKEGRWTGFRQWDVYPRDPSTQGGA